MSTMEEILKWVTFSVQMLPLILQGVLLAEGAIGAGNGPAKKEMVMSLLPPANEQDPMLKDATYVTSSLIDHTVHGLNMARKLPLPAATAH